MLKCIDERTGALLHAYELRTLSEEETGQFEIHLLHCEYCFARVSEFEKYASTIHHSDRVKESVGRFIGRRLESPTEKTGWRRGLWPKGSILLKPGLIYILALLLLIPSIYGIGGLFDEDSEIRPLKELTLIIGRSMRGDVDGDIFRKSDASDLAIAIGYLDHVPGHKYRISITDSHGELVAQLDNLNLLDDSDQGKILLPISQMKSGKYQITIYNQTNDSALMKDGYNFLIYD